MSIADKGHVFSIKGEYQHTFRDYKEVKEETA